MLGREAEELGYGEPGMIKVGPACRTRQSLDTIDREHLVWLHQDLEEKAESLEAELASASLVSLLSSALRWASLFCLRHSLKSSAPYRHGGDVD